MYYRILSLDRLIKIENNKLYTYVPPGIFLYSLNFPISGEIGHTSLSLIEIEYYNLNQTINMTPNEYLLKYAPGGLKI